MTMLAQLIGGLFGGLATWLATYVSKKVALAAAAVTTFAALTLAMIALLKALVAGITYTFPESNAVVISLLWTAIPDVLPGLIAIAFTTDAAIALYKWNVESLRIAATVS